jgi:DUF971 family protein
MVRTRKKRTFIRKVFCNEQHRYHFEMTPVKVRLKNEKQLFIQWSDGKECVYSLVQLRRKCPCAVCRADMESKGPAYIPLYAGDSLSLASITPMGNYALQFAWKDGHSTGIYDFEYLRSLCPDKEN